MSTIQNVPSNWRASYQQASFRGAIFFVETDARAGGRRVAMHEYPKRNTPYAEDMGRRAVRFTVQGYLIMDQVPTTVAGFTPNNYLDLKDALIAALEADGPGMLRLPLPYRKSDVMVQVQQYSVTESRERGGSCVIEMDFVEYGDPVYRPDISTANAVLAAAAAAELAMLAVATGTPLAGVFASAAFAQAASYYQVYSEAGVPPASANLMPTGPS